MTHVTINIRRAIPDHDLPLSSYQSAGSAGFDLLAAIPAAKSVTINPFERTLVPTGLIFEIPAGYEGQIRPRSGLALRHGITVLNSPGTIDSDYRGEVGIILVNLGSEPFVIRRGERIAQMVIAPVSTTLLVETTDLSETARGSGGFGSTGSA